MQLNDIAAALKSAANDNVLIHMHLDLVDGITLYFCMG